jgi:hypothetical protein
VPGHYLPLESGAFFIKVILDNDNAPPDPSRFEYDNAQTRMVGTAHHQGFDIYFIKVILDCAYFLDGPFRVRNAYDVGWARPTI